MSPRPVLRDALNRKAMPHRQTAMRRTLRLVAMVMVALGSIWFLQGIGVLPGSFMTGDPKWAVIGGILAATGLTWLVVRRRT